MGQLVELQKNLKSLHQAKIQVVAVSYDSVDVLKKFWQLKKIRYPLLSDPDSKTIKAFGVLNKEASPRIKGVPHPGTFLIDKKGIIRAKLFYSSYTKRHQAKDIIEASKKLNTKSADDKRNEK